MMGKLAKVILYTSPIWITGLLVLFIEWLLGGGSK